MAGNKGAIVASDGSCQSPPNVALKLRCKLDARGT